MGVVGLIGGTSWHSTVEIYQQVNAYVAEKMGGLHCAKLVVVNVDLDEIVSAKEPSAKAAVLQEAARSIERAGADCLALCSNGLHQFAEQIKTSVSIPFVHIAEVTAEAAIAAGFHTVGLLGVKELMEEDFYAGVLRRKGLRVLVPCEEEREYIDHVLFTETGVGVVKEESSRAFYRIAEELAAKGAACIILGCTEIGMLMQQEHTEIPLLDTTRIFAQTIGELCCEK